ncbi:MAG: NAD(P)/FAD-dependent oxidoreductase [Erysipelotrichaceae bacterium]|jgi:glycerol-3-phosphate dehydrogenase|nr:NAD(P)/FAD-dependent oxidoreductase [Erysipelotrichaceae bacterium]
MTTKKYDIVIIGAGVTGAVLARELARYQLDVLILDKENDVGNVTSMANSAIIHAGYDPLPGTLKAKLNVRGNALYPKLCEELDVSFKQSGSLVVATSEDEKILVQDLVRRGKQNGVKCSYIYPRRVLELEPNVLKDNYGALYCKTCGYIDPFNLVSHAIENALDNGVTLKLNHLVTAIAQVDGGYQVVTNQGSYETKLVINASGVNGVKVASLLETPSFKITPRKGEYFVLEKQFQPLVTRPIFPVPSKKGKGILVIPTTGGTYLVGPSSEYTEAFDDLATDTLTLNEIAKHAKTLVPSTPMHQVIRVYAGLRPTPSDGDFHLEPLSEKHPNFINLIGIESPGFASAPAVAEYVINKYLKSRLSLVEKKNYNPLVKKYVKLNELSDEARAALIKTRSDYGLIICNCEKISKGEILDLFSRSYFPTTIKGIKKRLRCGFGKCQGGFCGPKIVTLLSEVLKKDLNDINYDELETNIIIKESR